MRASRKVRTQSESRPDATMTLYEETVAALHQLPPTEQAAFIMMANQWLYDKRSPDLDYSEQIIVRDRTGKEASTLTRSKMRTAFLSHILSGVRHTLTQRKAHHA